MSRWAFALLRLLCCLGMALLLAGTACVAATPEELVTQEYQKDTGHGNLLAVQPYMTPEDYQSEETFFKKLDIHLAVARRKGWTGHKTIVVFPELIGFYLFALQERAEVYSAKSLPEAASQILSGRGLPLPSASDAALQIGRKVLELKAPLMAETYQRVFSRLARRYHVTIVAGSILLHSPAIRNGKLVCDITGDIYNVTAVFRPDGKIYPELARKVFPTLEEVQKLGIARGKSDALPFFETPAGKLGIAICADAWYPDTYRSLQKKGVRMIVVPSNEAPATYLQATWKGYSLSPGIHSPEDVDPADIGKLTELQAWEKYAMPGRLPRMESQAAISCGLTVFSRGRLWQDANEGDAPAVVLNGKYVLPQQVAPIPAVISVWL